MLEYVKSAEEKGHEEWKYCSGPHRCSTGSSRCSSSSSIVAVVVVVIATPVCVFLLTF